MLFITVVVGLWSALTVNTLWYYRSYINILSTSQGVQIDNLIPRALGVYLLIVIPIASLVVIPLIGFVNAVPLGILGAGLLSTLLMSARYLYMLQKLELHAVEIEDKREKGQHFQYENYTMVRHFRKWVVVFVLLAISIACFLTVSYPNKWGLGVLFLLLFLHVEGAHLQVKSLLKQIRSHEEEVRTQLLRHEEQATKTE